MELKDLKGLGKVRLESLSAAGIFSLRDLLSFLPKGYKDVSELTPIGELRPGEAAAVRARVKTGPRLSRYRGLTSVTATLEDDTGHVPCVWYNQPWMMNQLAFEGKRIFYGRAEVKNKRLTLLNPTREEAQRITPIYRPLPGIPGKVMRDIMAAALVQVEDCCPETLPRGLRLRYALCEKNFAIREAHFPGSRENLALARRRLSFEDALFYQAAMGLLRGRKEAGVIVPATGEMAEKYWKALPFAPTGAQKKALLEIIRDLDGITPMSRLVQGDVGCGKTAIAFGALAVTAWCGFQGALMAPTEILARQHLESARDILEPLGIKCGLLVGGMKAKERREALSAIASGEWQAVIGTHALISEGVMYSRLGLVVTDEQHRFGVRQRTALSDKGTEKAAPNVLVLSATPIPRTLALILYGDLDVSVVDELPPGRRPVATRIVPEEKREGMYAFLHKEVEAGRQAYIVCPLVEESDSMEEVKSAQRQYKELKAGPLRGLRVGLTYGKQPAQEKAEVLEAFQAGDLNVLVATTVIEVGVNVPNATVMVIENADRYGLSQLHQLRGRVGRGSRESWCFLLAKPSERLKILTKTSDGFEIARKDLELRGPGEILGTRQHGVMAAPGAALDGDVALLKQVQDCMEELRRDPALKAEKAIVEAHAAQFLTGRLTHVALN